MDKTLILDSRVIDILNPKETAIIVVDVMDAYCDPNSPLPNYYMRELGCNFHDIDKAVDRIVSFLETSRKFPIATTVFVRMIEAPEFSPPSIKLKMEVEKFPAAAVKNGPGWNYYKVRPLHGDFEITKYNYDAFRNTDLDMYLKKCGVKTVIIMGVDASVCVDTTARSAAQCGYHTFVPADLTADMSMPNEPQTPDVIRKRLDTINSVMGYMPLSSDILSIWELKK